MKTGIFIALSFLSCFSLTSQVPSYVPTTGLQGWWPFTGNANDLSGNGRHGTVSGAALTNDRFNSSNCAYSFNGSSFISTNYSGILGTSSRAVSFWARTTHSVTVLSAVDWGSNTTAGRYECGFNYGAPGVMLDGGWGVITYNTPSPIYDNNWHHYVVQIVNSSVLSQVQLYQDAVLLTTTSHVYSGTNVLNTGSAANVHFGRTASFAYYWMNGQLDDIGIWDRYLTQCEIQALYLSSTMGVANVSVNVNPVTCFGANNGSATLTVSGGSGNITYSWSPGTSTSSVITGLSAGIYTYAISGSQICSHSSTLSITQPPLLSLNVISSAGTVCPGTPVNFAMFGTGGSPAFSYSWINGPSTNTWQVNYSNPGLYTHTATLTDSKGCVKTSSVGLLVLPSPQVLFPIVPAICQGATMGINPNVSSGTPSYQFNWSSGQTTQNLFINGTTPGSFPFTLTVTDSKGCVGSGTTNLVVHPTPSLSVSGPSVGCTGKPIILTASASGGTPGYNYVWSNSTTASTILVTQVLTGNYSFTANITDANGCSAMQVVQVNIIPTPTITISAPKVVCLGNPAQLTASGGNTYHWSTNQTTGTITVTPANTSMYTVIGTAVNSCTAAASVTVLVSECLGLESGTLRQLKAYPNPTSDKVTIGNADLCASFSVYDVTGKLLDFVKVNSEVVTIDLSLLPAGIYLLKGEGNGTYINLKLIRQ